MTTLPLPGLYGPPTISQPGPAKGATGAPGAAGATGATGATGPSGADLAYTVWNPDDKQANWVLSNGNLTGFNNTGVTTSLMRGTLARSTGKYYFELTADTIGSASSYVIGLANASETLVNKVGGVGSNSIGIEADGSVFFNNSAVVVGGGYAAGSHPAVAVDLTAKRAWFWSPAVSKWNNDASANPATGVGGLDISSISPAALYPAFSTFGGSGAQQGTANFGATAFSLTIPAGFTAWGTPAPNGNFLDIHATGNVRVDGNVAINGSLTVAGAAIVSNKLAQIVNVETGAVATGTTVLPFDNSIPQSGEGDQYMSLAITPQNAGSILLIDVVIALSSSIVGTNVAAALFQDATAGALAAMGCNVVNADALTQIAFSHKMIAGTTGATTFKVRAGAQSAGTTTFNGSAAARLFGGVLASSITITEMLP